MVSFRIDDTTALEEKAKAAGVTRSEFVRQLVAGLGESGGVWVASYIDRSSIYVFSTEVDAFRHANGTGMDVRFVPFGDPL